MKSQRSKNALSEISQEPSLVSDCPSSALTRALKISAQNRLKYIVDVTRGFGGKKALLCSSALINTVAKDVFFTRVR